MAKFKYRLQPILNLKSQIEDNLKNELGKALRKLQEEEAVLLGLEQEREENIEILNRKASAGITVESLKRHNAYIYRLREEIISQKENVNCARLNVDKVRGELVKIMQEREMLDRLKDKKYQAFLKEQLKKEQRLNDEIVSFRQSNTFTGD